MMRDKRPPFSLGWCYQQVVELLLDVEQGATLLSLSLLPLSASFGFSSQGEGKTVGSIGTGIDRIARRTASPKVASRRGRMEREDCDSASVGMVKT
jgi:hypothetical protein